MLFKGPIEDRLAIRERIEAYADAVFRRDAESWISNWTEDAVWDLAGTEVAGRETIKGAWLHAMSAFPLAAFFAHPGSIQVEGKRATARVYTQEMLTLAEGGVRRIVGVYEDELIKADGSWLFSRRSYRILHDETGA